MRPRHSLKHGYKKIILFVPTSLIFRCDYVANLRTLHLDAPLYTSRLHLPVYRHDLYPYIITLCPAFQAPLTFLHNERESLRLNSQREMRSRCMSATLCYPTHCSYLPVTQPVTRVSARHGPLVRHVPGSNLGTRDRLF